jgi:hypothetical protein
MTRAKADSFFRDVFAGKLAEEKIHGRNKQD